MNFIEQFQLFYIIFYFSFILRAFAHRHTSKAERERESTKGHAAREGKRQCVCVRGGGEWRRERERDRGLLCAAASWRQVQAPTKVLTLSPGYTALVLQPALGLWVRACVCVCVCVCVSPEQLEGERGVLWRVSHTQ